MTTFIVYELNLNLRKTFQSEKCHASQATIDQLCQNTWGIKPGKRGPPASAPTMTCFTWEAMKL